MNVSLETDVVARLVLPLAVRLVVLVLPSVDCPETAKLATVADEIVVVAKLTSPVAVKFVVVMLVKKALPPKLAKPKVEVATQRVDVLVVCRT